MTDSQLWPYLFPTETAMFKAFRHYQCWFSEHAHRRTPSSAIVFFIVSVLSLKRKDSCSCVSKKKPGGILVLFCMQNLYANRSLSLFKHGAETTKNGTVDGDGPRLGWPLLHHQKRTRRTGNTLKSMTFYSNFGCANLNYIIYAKVIIIRHYYSNLSGNTLQLIM